MGKINEYQRSQLASSAVGVAGPDKSGQIIGQGVEQLGGAIVAQAQEKNKMDTIQANTAVMQFGLVLQELNTSIQAEVAGNPDAYGETLMQRGNELREVYTNSIQDPGVREVFTLNANTLLRGAVSQAPA